MRVSKMKFVKNEGLERLCSTDIFLVNWMHEDHHYQFLLKKLQKYVPYLPSSLKALICYLPKGTAYVD
jgi:hypothetical protein